jgi:hypothetical protein
MADDSGNASKLTRKDWLQFAGVILAAVIGGIFLLIVAERQGQGNDRATAIAETRGTQEAATRVAALLLAPSATLTQVLDTATAEPTPLPTPSSSPTLAPTLTPTPTDLPTPSSTPTLEPAPTATASRTATIAPSESAAIEQSTFTLLRWNPDYEGQGAGMCVNSCDELFLPWSEAATEIASKVLPQVEGIPPGSWLRLDNMGAKTSWVVNIRSPKNEFVGTVFVGGDPQNDWKYDGLLRIAVLNDDIWRYTAFARYSDGSYTKQ